MCFRRVSSFVKQTSWDKLPAGVWTKNGLRLIPFTYRGHKLGRCCDSIRVIVLSLLFSKNLLLKSFVFNSNLSVHFAKLCLTSFTQDSLLLSLRRHF